MKTWQEVMTQEKELMEFLQRKEFFNKPYNGNRKNQLVVFNPAKAEYFFNKITDHGDWQDIQNRDYGDIEELPSDNFMSQCLEYVSKELTSKDKEFHNADNLINNLRDNMISDFCRMFDFSCMEIEYPPVWKIIKDTYLSYGWPCGWEGEYPDGKMVIFSNEGKSD